MALNDRRILMRALSAGTLVAARALSACGRRGPLEPPPGAAAYEADPAITDPVEAKKAQKPDRPFFLDWLL